MLNEIETTYLRIVRGEITGSVAFLLKLFFLPISWLYGLIISFRNKAYDLGIFKTITIPSQTVISIGNITVGGTGKTPITLMLSQELSTHFSTAILSRGYRSEAEHLKLPMVLCCGNGPEFPVQLSGDEAYMLAENLPHTTICVGKNRCKAAHLATDLGVELVILDDGMQYRKLSRDLDIVVIDTNDPFGQGYYLPRGLLRDEIKSLKRADLIVLNNITNEEQYQASSKKISAFSKAPIVGTRVESPELFDLNGLPVKSLKSKKIGMFCGIAKPQNFSQTLKNMGFDIIDELKLGDHRLIDEKQLRIFSDCCKQQGADYLCCTEKDKVKIPKNFDCSLPLIWAKMELRICGGVKHWHAFLSEAKEIVATRRNQ